jgi:4-hydroxybenzoate polyprenyltransferase
MTSHPGPSAAITALIMLLVVRDAPQHGGLFGVGVLVGVTALLAVLAGELSIGWSNDYFDAGRDAAAGRSDKPLVRGDVTRQAVLSAALLAVAASCILAFTISTKTGVINLLMMFAGWTYNAGLKSTPASGLAYALGFGLIPAFAASTFPTHPNARPWTLVAAAFLGVGGHFANVLPDLAADKATGVKGLPNLIASAAGENGERAVRAGALILLLGTSALIAFSPGRPPAWPRVAGFVLAAGLALVALRSSGRGPFLAAIAIAGIDAALFAFGGVGLV